MKLFIMFFNQALAESFFSTVVFKIQVESFGSKLTILLNKASPFSSKLSNELYKVISVPSDIGDNMREGLILFNINLEDLLTSS